jgi:uncharacterized protein (TIGR00251 family)
LEIQVLLYREVTWEGKVYHSSKACKNVDPGAILREVKGGTEIDISVSPNSSRSGIEGIDPWRKRLVVRVNSIPKDGRANKELCDVLMNVFSVPVTVLRGQTSRTKTVMVPLDRESVLAVIEGII